MWLYFFLATDAKCWLMREMLGLCNQINQEDQFGKCHEISFVVNWWLYK